MADLTLLNIREAIELFLYNEDFWTWKNQSHYGQFVAFLPLIAAVVSGQWRQTRNRPLLHFCAFSLFMEYVSTNHKFVDLFVADTNAPFYYLFTPFLFLFLSRIFIRHPFVRRPTRWVLGFFTVCTLITVANALWGDGFLNFPSKVVGLYSMAGMVFCINHLAYMLRQLETPYLERLPMFWVSAGFLIYFAGNFLLWLGMNLLTYDPDFFWRLYEINVVVSVLLYLLMTVAVLVTPSGKTASLTY